MRVHVCVYDRRQVRANALMYAMVVNNCDHCTFCLFYFECDLSYSSAVSITVYDDRMVTFIFSLTGTCAAEEKRTVWASFG